MKNPNWQIILDDQVIAYGKEFNRLPFFDNTISKDTKWRIYTIVENPPRLCISGNECNGYSLDLSEDILSGIKELVSEMPNERVEFMDPEQPHKTIDIDPTEFNDLETSFRGKRKYHETYWYRNVGRATWEIGQGVGAVLNTTYRRSLHPIISTC